MICIHPLCNNCLLINCTQVIDSFPPNDNNSSDKYDSEPYFKGELKYHDQDNLKESDQETKLEYEVLLEESIANNVHVAFSPASTLQSSVQSRFFINKSNGEQIKTNLEDDFIKTAKSKVNYELGPKGQVIIHNTHPRQLKPFSAYESEFFTKVFNGDSERGKIFIAEFKNINAENPERANGMLATLISAGVNQRLLQKLFGIGCNRFYTIKQYGQKTYKPRSNSNKVTNEQIDMLQVCRDAIPLSDEGFSCNHRCQQVYIGDPMITSIEKLYEKYYLTDDYGVSGKRMALPTFRKYWHALHSDLRFKQLKEDECDTCIELQTALADKTLPISEKNRIKDILAMHRDVARELRLGMREAIKLYAKNFMSNTLDITADTTIQMSNDSIDRSVARIPTFSDEPLTDTNEDSLDCAKVWLMCQDFAGNFPLPFYGSERPGKDYFLSNLATYVFVVSDLSRNRNSVYIYDERGMGKDGNAMCSLRLNFFLDSLNGTRAQTNMRPPVLMLILDNCVGQNKSQVIYIIIL